jgi:hypothetical protein
VPAALHATGIATLDVVLKTFGAPSTRPATKQCRCERLVRMCIDRRLIAEFPEKAYLSPDGTSQLDIAAPVFGYTLHTSRAGFAGGPNS